MVVKILFLESSLELVPKELYDEPDVIRSARRYEIQVEKLILDKSLHYKAMRRLDKKWKRGRPDILHVSLLLVTDSPLMREGLIEVYFHIFDGRVFKVRNDVRIPKHLERFKGVMSDLLRTGRVPLESRDPLIYMAYSSLEEFIEREGKLILLWEKGEHASPDAIVMDSIEEKAVIGIGAFPQGDFEESTLRLSYKRYAIAGGYPMASWSVMARLLCSMERLLTSEVGGSYKNGG